MNVINNFLLLEIPKFQGKVPFYLLLLLITFKELSVAHHRSVSILFDCFTYCLANFPETIKETKPLTEEKIQMQNGQNTG